MREVSYFVGFVGFEPKFEKHFFESEPIKKPNYERPVKAGFNKTKANHRSRKRDSKFIISNDE